MDIRSILLPATPPSCRYVGTAVAILLAISALLILISPLFIEQSYSWVSNSISESAAQNLSGAWVTRLGFICFGVGVIWLSASLRKHWGRGAYWCHIAFGLCMVSTAAFSHKPWISGIAYDEFEDFLHSFTATAMGFAYSFGVVVCLCQRSAQQRGQKFFDLLALIVATVIPLIAWYWQDISGLVQRGLFFVAYLWYGNEALRSCSR